jgi:hypothetical protein
MLREDTFVRDILQGGVLFKFIYIFFLNISDLNFRTNKQFCQTWEKKNNLT